MVRQPGFERSSGLLLHVTSLPGGRLGAEADRFVAFLEGAGQRWWQILPLGPPGYGASPYAALSAFAGNDALLPPAREPLSEDDLRAYRARHRAWLPDYAVFRALHERYRGRPWWQWPRPLRDHDTAAVRRARSDLAERVRAHEEAQCRFDRAWLALRRRCRDAGVRLIGDLPLFVARDSADVWAHRSLFRFDAVAGVPPDAFTEDGQLWGNPLYAWDAHRRSRFRWWVRRFERAFELVDTVRIDHFLGLHRIWEVPARARSARRGKWVTVPGDALLRAVRSAVGTRSMIAENLGILTEEAESLRKQFGIPGMHVLQFCFGPDRDMRPFWFPPRSVVYTGTHDNDTVRGWQASANGDGGRARRYLGCRAKELPAAMLRLAWLSASNLALAPVQDLLGLGSAARMNVPGRAEGNWTWRLRRGQLGVDHARRLRALTKEAGR
ncbi:MAG: 4-alpha-glucanotransferase [Planctomycetota bacterium]|jgi:4-alpha-glucanotransferase